MEKMIVIFLSNGHVTRRAMSGQGERGRGGIARWQTCGAGCDDDDEDDDDEEYCTRRTTAA